jgi:hypothetical protein
MAKEQASFFTVIVTGQVEFADVRPRPDRPAPFQTRRVFSTRHEAEGRKMAPRPRA